MRGLSRGILVLAISTGVASAQRGPGFDIDFDQVQVRTEHVAGQVHMLAGAGGNLGVFAGEDGVFLVDDQFAPLTGRIREAVAAISGEPIRFIINTHFHDDHTGGNENFGEAGALIVAHDNVRRTLAVPHFIETVNTEFPAFAPSALPVITFSDAVTFHLNGEEVEVFHAPGAHTDGDAIVYFRGSDVIHMGDIFRSRGPVFDHNNGGSLRGMIAAADRVLSMMGADTRIIPGHGRVSGREDLLRARDSMVIVRERIAEGVAAGKTLGEIIAENPTEGFDWSSPRLLTLERVIEWIYLELSEER